MKIGILGTGFGLYHGDLYRQIPLVEGLSIFGRNLDKLEGLRKAFDEVTSDPFAIFEDGEVGLVDVCLPSAVHAEYGLKAIASGKDVLLETPAVLGVADAEALILASEAGSRHVYVNLFIRFEPAYVWLKEKVDSGLYGALKSLKVRRETAPIWGDLGLEKIGPHLMIHDFDFVTWLLGLPDAVDAKGMAMGEKSAMVSAHLSYKGASVEVQGASCMPMSYPFTVGFDAIFEEASVHFLERGYEDRVEASMVVYTKSGAEKIALPEANCYLEALKHVVACVQAKEKSPCLDLSEALLSLKVAFEVGDIVNRK